MDNNDNYWAVDDLPESPLEVAIRFGEDAYKRAPNRIDHYTGIHVDMLRRLIDAAKITNADQRIERRIKARKNHVS